MPTHSKPWLESVYTAATGQRRVYGGGATLTVCVDIGSHRVKAIAVLERG